MLRRELKGHLHQKLGDSKVNNLGVHPGKVTEKLEVLQVPVTPEVRKWSAQPSLVRRRLWHTKIL